tara:strand:+ start:53 stop:409 length:357 start_codon:yes stop_codon:yes gene_type:complete
MRLYTNNKGEWTGTQADAKKAWGKDMALVEVPVSKDALMAWLNKCRVVSQSHAEIAKRFNTPSEAPQVTSPQYNHPWATIKECAEKASLKDLGVALSVLMNRLDEVADQQKEQSNADS